MAWFCLSICSQSHPLLQGRSDREAFDPMEAGPSQPSTPNAPPPQLGMAPLPAEQPPPTPVALRGWRREAVRQLRLAHVTVCVCKCMKA